MLMTSPTFCCFDKFLRILYSYKVSLLSDPNGKVKLGGLFAPPPSILEVSRTPVQNRDNSNFGAFSRLLTLFELGFCQPKKKVQLIFIKLIFYGIICSIFQNQETEDRSFLVAIVTNS